MHFYYVQNGGAAGGGEVLRSKYLDWGGSELPAVRFEIINYTGKGGAPVVLDGATE